MLRLTRHQLWQTLYYCCLDPESSRTNTPLKPAAARPRRGRPSAWARSDAQLDWLVSPKALQAQAHLSLAERATLLEQLYGIPTDKR